jgi:hypothetical protein
VCRIRGSRWRWILLLENDRQDLTIIMDSPLCSTVEAVNPRCAMSMCTAWICRPVTSGTISRSKMQISRLCLM